jgi:putative MATE family efflux protein
MDRKSSLVTGSIGWGLLYFVVPLMLGSFVQELYITVDSIIVGRFAGKEALAAIDSVNTLFRFPLNFMNGMAAGATILVSRYFGENRPEKIRTSVLSAGLLAVVLGVVCSIAGAGLSRIFVGWMQVPENISDRALCYTRIYFGGLWTLIVYNMAAGILRSFGDSKSPLYILMITAVVNVFGDLLLVAVFKTDVAGAATATVFSQFLSAAMAVYMIYRKLGQLPGSVSGLPSQAYDADNAANADDMPGNIMPEVAHIAKTGIPLALQSMLFPVANTILQTAINTMGTDVIAGWGIFYKQDTLIWLISDNMSPALTTYTAQNLGAGKPDRVRKGVRIGLAMSVGAVLVVSVLLYIFTGSIAAWFVSAGDAASVVPISVRFMRCMAPFFFTYAIAEALSGACCGTGDTVKPMVLTLLTTCLLRIVVLMIFFPIFASIECISAVYVISWTASALCFMALWMIWCGKLL